MGNAGRGRPTRGAQVRYLEAGLEVLAERGRGGLKLATVCGQVGATSGSFYHAFASWSDFTDELIRFWREEKSTSLIEESRLIESPRERLDHLVRLGVRLPHRSEAAIRAWGAIEPEVASVVREVDRERLDALTECYADLTSESAARRHAIAAMHLLVGHETSALGDAADLHWAFEVLLQHAVAAPSGQE